MLVNARGEPISSQDFKKAPTPRLGPAFGDWSGRDERFNQLPGSSVLQFDLDSLTLADFRAMRYHPQINSSLSLLTFMMHQLDWWIECKDAKIAAMVEENLRDTWTRMIRALSQSFWAGYSPIILDYENDLQAGVTKINKFKDMVPEEYEVNWKQVEGYAPEGHVKPKYKIYDGMKRTLSGSRRVWSDGTYVNPAELGSLSMPPVPVENTLWYPLLMENGDFYGKKLLKSVFSSWYFSIIIHLYANRYYERYGEPTPLGRAPFDETVETSPGEFKNGKAIMQDILMSLRNRSVVVLPSDRDPVTKDFDYTLEYIESQMRGADFERYLTRLDEEISLGIFTPILLMTAGDVGSHNLGVQHTQTFMWMLNALAGDLKEYIDHYVCERLKAINFSPNAPRCQWRFRPMGKENVETIRAIMSALLGSNKVKVDTDELGMYLGMTVTEIEGAIDDPVLEPGKDDREVRDKPKRTSPRGVSEPRATGREVSNRIRSQVERAFRNGDLHELKPDFGYTKRMIQAWRSEGHNRTEAETLAANVFSELETWVTEAASIGSTEYSGSADFMSMFDRALDLAIDRAASNG